MSHSSIVHIRDTMTDRTVKPPGRPSTIPLDTLEAIKRYVDLNWHTACKPWQEILRDFGLSCSVQTLRRALHREGYGSYIAARAPLRTRKQRQRRTEWAAQHLHDDWTKILWSDECTFEFDLRIKQRVIRRRGTRNTPNKIQWQKQRKGPGRWNIWAAIGYNYKSPLIWLKGSGKNGAFLQKDYLSQVLEPHLERILAEMATKCGCTPTFMEDGNAAHGCKSTKNPVYLWKQLHKIKLLDWAANSPDMNPIEQIWRIIKQALRKRRAELNTQAQFLAAVEEEYERIPLSKINELISTMRQRVETMYLRFGDVTGF
jgi:hypothetical protein